MQEFKHSVHINIVQIPHNNNLHFKIRIFLFVILMQIFLSVKYRIKYKCLNVICMQNI